MVMLGLGNLVRIAGCVGLAAGCAASTDGGSTQLRVTGQASAPAGSATAGLVPAIAFRQRHSEELLVMDGRIDGDLDGGFTLELSEPPPRSALFAPEDDPTEATWAVGFFAALHSDHPERIPTGDPTSQPVTCSAEGCRTEAEWCPEDGSACYRRVTLCDEVDENCRVISESGDRELSQARNRVLAGLSTTHALLYLETPARAGSVLAYGLN